MNYELDYDNTLVSIDDDVLSEVKTLLDSGIKIDIDIAEAIINLVTIKLLARPITL